MVDGLVTAAEVAGLLNISEKKAELLVSEAKRLYVGKMNERFSDLRINERLKRTNPFLLRIRGLNTVKGGAEAQVQAVLFASEEEAVGHLLEAIAKICYPGAHDPEFPDDLDFEASDDGSTF